MLCRVKLIIVKFTSHRCTQTINIVCHVKIWYFNHQSYILKYGNKELETYTIYERQRTHTIKTLFPCMFPLWIYDYQGEC